MHLSRIKVGILFSSAIILSALFASSAQAALTPINDLRIAGDQLIWTAPREATEYKISFHTGEATSITNEFGGCGYDLAQERNPGGPDYCAGTANSIRFNAGRPETFNIKSTGNSFVVQYKDRNGNLSPRSNFVVHRYLPEITDLKFNSPDQLNWTAPQHAYNYKVLFHTGEARSLADKFDGCIWGAEDINPRGSEYCVGKSISINHRAGNTEKLKLATFAQGNSFVVRYFDKYGNASPLSNFVYTGERFVPLPLGDTSPEAEEIKTLPPAGYEDEVITTFDLYNNPFPDTNIGYIGGQAAAELYRRGVLGGYPDGEFKGNRKVNRAEAAKFLLLARYGDVADTSNNGQFRDVLDGEWYTKYVVRAANLGVIAGHPDGTFRPADTVNTAEFIKMLTLAFDIPLGALHGYDDVPSNAWFTQYAGIAYQYNLFPDRNPNYLEPGRTLTRTEIAVAIYQYLKSR